MPLSEAAVSISSTQADICSTTQDTQELPYRRQGTHISELDTRDQEAEPRAVIQVALLDLLQNGI